MKPMMEDNLTTWIRRETREGRKEENEVSLEGSIKSPHKPPPILCKNLLKHIRFVFCAISSRSSSNTSTRIWSEGGEGERRRDAVESR